jgi:hypothetical protein
MAAQSAIAAGEGSTAVRRDRRRGAETRPSCLVVFTSDPSLGVDNPQEVCLEFVEHPRLFADRDILPFTWVKKVLCCVADPADARMQASDPKAHPESGGP